MGSNYVCDDTQQHKAMIYCFFKSKKKTYERKFYHIWTNTVMGHKNPFLKVVSYTLILTVFWDALVGLFPALIISFIHRWGRNDVDFYSQSDVSFWYWQLGFREDTSVKLFPWDPAELMSAFNTRCWGGDFRRLLGFTGDARLWSRCEWILWVDPYLGSLCVLGLFYC